MVVFSFGTPVLLVLGIVTIFHVWRSSCQGGPNDSEPQTRTTALRTAAKAAPRPLTHQAISRTNPHRDNRSNPFTSLSQSLKSLACTLHRKSHRLRNIYVSANLNCFSGTHSHPRQFQGFPRLNYR
ncbi:hypothetical protein GE21DRAFT_1131535 [Neurospora crassa]|nr:hypothetical protein GE21DRAFT_1131535 [Neurospora crassa]